MKWEEISKIYPNRCVLLQVLENHVEGEIIAIERIIETEP